MAVFPKIMIPLVTHGNELRFEQRALEEEAKKVMGEQETRRSATSSAR